MAALREPLAQFVSDVFLVDALRRQILLRGVYFTSGTQDGTQIDRLLGSIGRRFGVAPEAVAPPAAGRGKAYFVERLLKDVVIGESGLAGVNRRLEMRKAAWQLGAYAAAVLVLVVGLIVLSVSYGKNRTYLAQVAHRRRDAAPGDAGLQRRVARSVAAALQCRPRGVRFREQISGRYPVGDALGTVSGGVGRQFRDAMPTCASWTASCCRDSRRASGSGSSTTGRSRRSCTSI